jgi:starvation-inducible outer membrane lipoprotein
MKTLLIVCLALTLACAMLVPQAIAGNKVKVDVCHVLAVNDTIPNFLDTEMTIYYGKVINVSENAVYSHL